MDGQRASLKGRQAGSLRRSLRSESESSLVRSPRSSRERERERERTLRACICMYVFLEEDQWLNFARSLSVYTLWQLA